MAFYAGFAFSVLSFSFTDSLFFIVSCSFVDDIVPVQPVTFSCSMTFCFSFEVCVTLNQILLLTSSLNFIFILYELSMKKVL